MDEAWDEMDNWCAERAAKISAKAGQHVMDGGKLTAPKYRTMLGKHQAYMAMRSFIHGARKAAKETTPDHREETRAEFDARHADDPLCGYGGHYGY